MKELDEFRKRARATREDLSRTEEAITYRRNLLRRRHEELARALRHGLAGTEEARALQDEIEALKRGIDQEARSAKTLKSSQTHALGAPALQAQPWELVEGLNDRLPFLLLPLRIETRFMSVEGRKELWVRIYPDDNAVHTHEKNLTDDEIMAGKTYWREIWRARKAGKVEIEKAAWRALASAFGGSRAAWVKAETEPTSLDVPTADALEFPEFPEETIKPDSWSQAPRSKVMPDCFVVMGFLHGTEIFRKVGNPIRDPLILGPDPEPQPEEPEFRREAGELLVGEEIAWIYDFEKAVEFGMGVKIELIPPVDEGGLSQLLVLGLRLSADETESQALVEELLENHSYSPDGLSFIPQGTPTNNTERQGSGFSSIDPGAETSFALETGDPLFEPLNDPLSKCDGQRLAEALGIDHTLFQRIHHADQTDVREALLMNRALWSGILGYYMEEMLGIKLETIEKLRTFFKENVTGRGLLPAIRAGNQPYGVLLTSNISNWEWSQELDGTELPELENLSSFMRTLNATMAKLVPMAAHIGAEGDQDPFQNLLNTLGLQASSIEFYRRHAVGSKYLWNLQALISRDFGNPSGRTGMINELRRLAGAMAEKVGINRETLLSIFALSFFQRQDLIRDPVVDDILEEETEKLFETKKVRPIYQAPDPQNPGQMINTNYIGWLGSSPYAVIKEQIFVNSAGEAQPIPRPLLYRMLRSSYLQALFDAALKLYIRSGLITPEARREVELGNIIQGNFQQTGTVTRWEFLDEDISKVLKQEESGRSIAEFLLSERGLSLSQAVNLRETLESIRALTDLSTAQLERAFAEHIDLCSYRLDAWQTGCFNHRLQQQRFPPESEGKFDNRVQGLYLGAFGWVEDLHPAPEMTPADLTSIPTSLHDPQQDGMLFEQPGNAGFIHGPSPNHAVTAAILRNAYLMHFDPDQPEKMAVSLSSERVRIALAFLDSVRNGQELGALLGYQFERGLHDRHNDPSLDKYIPLFRQQYPLLAEKITPTLEEEAIDSNGPIPPKEARNVFDGYALVEAVFLKEPKLEYPYNITGLPPIETQDAQEKAHIAAIQAEVARMADSLDAIADLALAEGVYQVAQGNLDRAGSILKAMTQGENPPDPEIVRTPRTGAAITQRVALHLPIGENANRWPGPTIPRAIVEPGLNAWLGDLLPNPDKITYTVSLAGGPQLKQNLAALRLQPIDLVYMIGDDLAGETTELESRIIFENRRQGIDDNLEVRLNFMVEPENPLLVNLFELLPLLRALRRFVTSSRPLGARDYQLPSETSVDFTENPNPLEIISNALKSAEELERRVGTALSAFRKEIEEKLKAAIPPNGEDGQPDANQANADNLRVALRTLSDFGVPDAFPLSAFGESGEAKSTLTRQAVNIQAIVALNLDKAETAKGTGDDALATAKESQNIAEQNLGNAESLKAAGDKALTSVDQSIVHYRTAAQLIFGPAFNLIPIFSFNNQAELQAAAAFRDANPPNNLTRHHKDNPLLVDEWIEGAARVQPNLSTLETITVLGENFGQPRTQQKPLQLPFLDTDYWVAVEYPETFIPEGEFLSMLQVLPASGFKAAEAQSGLLIDEWVETIPSRSETTGIAFHFNQPNSEPPQVCLLAVTPQVTGTWTWDKLVGILQDTLQRAKQRAVEPEQLGDTAYAHLLPAVIAPIASRRFATITTDFVHQTSNRFLD